MIVIIKLLGEKDLRSLLYERLVVGAVSSGSDTVIILVGALRIPSHMASPSNIFLSGVKVKVERKRKKGEEKGICQ